MRHLFYYAKLLLFPTTTKKRSSARRKNLLTKRVVRVKKAKPYIYHEQTIYLARLKHIFTLRKYIVCRMETVGFVCSQLRKTMTEKT